MNLWTTLELYGGGPGSGCHGSNCGRPAGSGQSRDVTPESHTPPPGYTPSSEMPSSVARRLVEMVKPPTQHVPDVVKQKVPKKPREFKENPKHVGGFFRPNTVAANVYNELNSKPGEWFHINDHLMKNFGGQAVITAIYNIKAAGIQSGKWDLQRDANRVRLVKTEGKAAPKFVADKEEQHLLTAPITKMGDNIGGASKTRVVYFTDGTKGIFKPDSGEPRGARAEIKYGYQSAREASAWQVAKLVGMQDLVPPSIIRTVNGEKGVMMKFKPGKEAEAVSDDLAYDGKQDLVRAAAFDYVVGNTDRHQGNWLVTSAGKLTLIDHGLSFPDTEYKVGRNKKFIQKAADSVPDEPKNAAGPYVEKKSEILEALKRVGLSDAAVKGVGTRIDALARANSWPKLYKSIDKGWG